MCNSQWIKYYNPHFTYEELLRIYSEESLRESPIN